MAKKITKEKARQLLRDAGIDLSKDYHQLRSSQVDMVVAVAKLYGYRKSPTAPGSTGRMFYEMLNRRRK